MLTICYLLHTDLLKFRELKKTCQATCFFYQLWTTGALLKYLLTLQTTTPKVSPKRLMSLDHKPNMRWRISGFVVILCKYGLLLKKSLAMSVREVIWAVSFDLLLKPNPYVDVNNVVGLWSQFVDHEFASWSKDLAGHVSPIHVVEWDMSLFWVLNKFTQKINNLLMWHGLPMR